MAIAALLAVTLDPAMRMLLTRLRPFSFRPRLLSRLLTRNSGWAPTTPKSGTRLPTCWGAPMPRLVAGCCGIPRLTVAAALALIASTVPIYLRLGSEFMPPLYEGSILYMPTTLRACPRPRQHAC